MKKLICCLLLCSHAGLAGAACISLDEIIPYTRLEAGQTIIVWGPQQLGNSTCHALLKASITTERNLPAPTLLIQRLNRGEWQTVQSSSLGSIASDARQAPGQFRLLLQNQRYPAPVTLTGTVTRHLP